MKDVRALMTKVGTGFLATTNGRCAAVRPMSAYLWVGKELWLATGEKSAKVADVQERSAVEFCAMDKDFAYTRIAGRARLSRTPADKRRIFGAFPWMKLYFQAAEDPSWLVLRIKPTRVHYMDADMHLQIVPCR
jgi:general stress protein 26